MPKRLGDFVEMTGRDGPVFVLVTDIRRIVQKAEQTVVVCESGKIELIEDRAVDVMACLTTMAQFREVDAR